MCTAPKKTMRFSSIFASMLSVAAFTFFSANAHATDLSSCGDIALDSTAQCEVDVSGGCSAKCTPVNVVASCSAQLQVSCNGNCTASADVSCTGSCDSTCETSCNANPGSFDCEGDCTGTCEGNCSSQCSSDSSNTNCMAECKANCSGSCSGKCTGVAPSADCTTKCQGSCGGSCTASANATCNINCQAQGEASCETQITGGCTAACSSPKGAIFCNGQFVNASDVDNCVDALKSLLNIQVSGSASSSCDGGTCEAEAQGQASASCSAAPGESPVSGGMLFAAIGMFGAAVARRKSQKKNRR